LLRNEVEAKEQVMSKTGPNSMSPDNLRVGKSYFLQNHGESTSFIVLETIHAKDYRIKDLLSLEIYTFSSLVRYGLGADFVLREIEETD
jgi:hypothetical protein